MSRWPGSCFVVPLAQSHEYCRWCGRQAVQNSKPFHRASDFTMAVSRWLSGDESIKETETRAGRFVIHGAKSRMIRKIKKSAMPCSMLITVGDGPG